MDTSPRCRGEMKILDESSRSQIYGVNLKSQIANRMTPLAGWQTLAFMLVASPNVKVWVEILPSNECAIGNLDVGAQGFLGIAGMDDAAECDSIAIANSRQFQHDIIGVFHIF